MTSPHLPQIEGAMARNLHDYNSAYWRADPSAVATSIEVAGGIAAFTGLESPLTTVKGAGPNLSSGDLRDIESFFRDHRAVTVTIEMAPWVPDDTARTLAESGYRVAGHEDVVISGSHRADPALRVEDVALDAWPAAMRRSYQMEDESVAADLYAVSALLPGVRLYAVRDDTDWIACAQAVAYDGVVIFGNDGTRPEARGRGAQRALIDARLQSLPEGAVAVAEVAPQSGSERNYLRCGFHVAYTRTHFVRSLG